MIAVYVLAGIGALVLYGVIGGLIARLSSSFLEVDDEWVVVCCVAWPLLSLLLISVPFYVFYLIGRPVFTLGRRPEIPEGEEK